MATKLKKCNPAATFVVFFIAVNLLLASLLLGLLVVADYGVGSIGVDYKKTATYQDQVYGGYLIEGLYAAMYPDQAFSMTTTKIPESSLAVENNAEPSVVASAAMSEGFSREGENLLWMIQNVNGEVFSSANKGATPEQFYETISGEMNEARNYYNPMAIVPTYAGYDHLLIVRDDGVLIERIGTRAGITEKQTNLGHSKYIAWMPNEMREMLQNPKSGGPVICLAIKSEGALLNNGGSLYSIYYDWFVMAQVMVVLGAMAVIAVLMLLGVLIKHKSMAIACEGIGRISGKLWLECKIVAWLFALGFGIYTLDFALWNGGMVEGLFSLFATIWLLWILCNDLRYNSNTLWKNNSVRTLMQFLHSLESKHPFCAQLKRRLLVLICAELALAFVGLMLILIFEGVGLFLDIFVAGLAIFLIIHYVCTYNKGIDQLSAVIDYTRRVRNGSVDQPLVLPQDSDYNGMAADLNDIHSGMAKMVDARLKSEQMKAELITNVSHDLKTPLTSIINYVDLLSKEELSPAYANDYVGILAKKSDRLKTLVQDLFEISKAQSGAIDFTPEKLNVVALLEQTVAEMDARSGQDAVDIRFQFAQPHVLVRADGKKLHRVFENLLGNALKYSLAGTRVYVSMQSNGQHVQIIFKNVAGYEMAFTEQEIVERFQRGDTARTSEGSGLGLAIAKSFLELNDGNLRVELDGDMFKAIVTLPVYQPDAPMSPAPMKTAPAPVVEAPAPMETAPTPVVEAPAPMKTAPAPVVEAPAPVKTAPAPVVEAPAPVKTAPASGKNSPAWVINVPVPPEMETAWAEERSEATIGDGSMANDVVTEASAVQATQKLPYEIASPFQSADKE